jgi:hypothetical protein
MTESIEMRMKKQVMPLLCAIAHLLMTAGASAQSLSVQGDRFAVNGEPRFLLFVSYFDGLQRPAAELIDRDLQYLKDRGVDGIRVFPDWHAPRLLDSSGAVNSERLERLLTLVERAGLKGMMVDCVRPRACKDLNVDQGRGSGRGGLRNIGRCSGAGKQRDRSLQNGT